MSLNRISILGIFVTTGSKAIVLKEIEKYLAVTPAGRKKKPVSAYPPMQIMTPNPEQIVRSVQQKAFAVLLNQADLAIPDGIGVSWAARITGAGGHVGRLSGSDLMDDLVNLAAEKGLGIGLIGGPPGLADVALECLRKKHTTLTGMALTMPEIRLQHGKISEDDKISYSYAPENPEICRILDHTARKLMDRNLRIVFIGMGAPKQEWVMHELSRRLITMGSNKPIVLMAVGGTFAFVAGKLPRAPRWVRNIGLEWLWRLILEPWRIGRQLSLVVFVLYVIRQKYLR